MDKDNKKYTVEENIQNDFELVNEEDVNVNSKVSEIFLIILPLQPAYSPSCGKRSERRHRPQDAQEADPSF